MSESQKEGLQSSSELTAPVNLYRNERSWYNRPHEQLVGEFRTFIKGRSERFGGAFTPEEIIRQKLDFEANCRHLPTSASEEDETKAKEFFSDLRSAWDALAYDRYEAGSSAEDMAGSLLHFRTADNEGGGPIITLSDPLQVKVIDALTEAVGIPHKRGQSEIAIPEKLRGRNYTKWILSDEYRSRLAQAKAKRSR